MTVGSVPSDASINPQAENWPAPATAWFGVAALMVASVVAILDRQILSLLVDPIRASLKLTDVQISVLQGPAFMIFYTLFGLPIGWLLDRSHRLRLVAAGIGIWTAGTVGCGLATSYEAMIGARALVGMGEAVVGPASISLLADYFSPTRRPLAFSVHGTAGMLGTGLALVSGGLLLTLAAGMEPLTMAGLPPIEGWRFVFIASAAPGILAAAMMLAAREPPRRAVVNITGSDQRLVAFLKSARFWLLAHFSAVCLIAVMTFALMNWLPSYLTRSYGWEGADVGFLAGAQFLVLGPLGILAGGTCVAWLQKRGRPDAALRVLRLSAAGLALSFLSFMLPWTATTILIPLSAAIFCISMAPTVSVLAIQQATPNQFRGRLAAIYFIVTNLVGSTAGPMITAGLTEYVYADKTQIGLSLATIAIVAGPVAFILLTIALRPFTLLSKATTGSPP
ncbi:MAG: MFS transporter [Sphingorhabdus sp.]